MIDVGFVEKLFKNFIGQKSQRQNVIDNVIADVSYRNVILNVLCHIIT